MRVEYIPILLGVLVALIGAALVWDARTTSDDSPMRDRRRRRRASIDGRGETLAGIGMLLLGAALIGRDWRYETITVLAGTVLILCGAIRNRAYFREVFLFRGSARRGLEPPDRPGKLRIR